MQNWIKQNDTWKYSSKITNYKNIENSIIPSELFTKSGDDDDDDNSTFVYSACRNLNNVFETYSNFFGQNYSQYDKYGYWINTYFDKKQALKEINDNTLFVKYCQNDELVFTSPFQKKSIDYISNYNNFSDTIDSKKLEKGDTILVKNQQIYNLTNYTFSKYAKKTVSIPDPTNTIREFFTSGNLVRFTNGVDIVFEDYITNLKVVVISMVEYIQFDTLYEIPDTATNVADIINGEYIVDNTETVQHNIYTFDGNNLISDVNEKWNKVIWINDGTTQFEKCYYLKPEILTEFTGLYYIYDVCTPCVIGHSIKYDISETIFNYATNPFKYLLMDYKWAENIRASYANLDEVSIQLNTNLETGVEYQFLKSCDSVDNILNLIENYHFNTTSPTLKFLQTNSVSVFTSTNKLTFDTINSRINLSNPTSGGTITFRTGDLVEISVKDIDSNSIIFNNNFSVTSWNNGTKILVIDPVILESVISDINTHNYIITVTNLSYFKDNQDLVRKFNSSYLTNYYNLVITGLPVGNTLSIMNKVPDLSTLINGDWLWVLESFDIYTPGIYEYNSSLNTLNIINNYGVKLQFKDGGKHYSNLEIEITSTLNSTLKLKYPNPNNPYTYNYNIKKLLEQTDLTAPTVYSSPYNLNYLNLNLNFSEPYKNIVSDDRFGFSENQIILGSDYFNTNIIKNTKLLIDNNTTTIDAFIIDIIVDETNTTYIILDKYIPASFAPSQGTTTTLTYYKELNDVATAIGVSSNLKRSVEPYAEALMKDSNTENFLTSIIYTDDNGVLKCNLTEISDNSLDSRQDFKPVEVSYIKKDGIILDNLVIDLSDWYVENNKLIIVPNLNNSKKIRFIDGLKESLILTPGHYQNKYAWILKDDVIALNAIVGCTKNPTLGQGDLVWYKGDWRGGTWEDGVWLSGNFRKGKWNNGIWKSIKVIDYSGDNVIKIESDTKNTYSNFNNGTWNNGICYGGTFNGNSVVWNNGIWNDGIFTKGIWNNGIWNDGSFDGYWYNGTWNGGDFKYGNWYNGIWNSVNGLSRFGTESTSTNKSIWYSGIWNSGQFHSNLNLNGINPIESINHKYSIWVSGTWNGGDWFGGTNIYCNFNSSNKPSTWHGGVWLGGWRITSTTDLGTFKRFIIDVTQYNTLLGLTIIKHGLNTNQKVHITGKTINGNSNDYSLNLFCNNFVNNGNIMTSGFLPLNISKNISIASNTTITCSNIPQPLIGPPVLDYTIESANEIDGRPWVTSTFSNSKFKKGIFKNGLFINSYFETGLFGGYFIKGYFGLEII
jgi:hypothetical protein